MSFVLDQVARVDAQLDRISISSLTTASSPSASRTSTWSPDSQRRPSARVHVLQAAIRSLSLSGSDRASLLRPTQVAVLLSALSDRREATGAIVLGDGDDTVRAPEEAELEWLLVSKATTQVYGHVLSSVLDQTVALADHVWYWDAVLSSRRQTVVYGIQTSPIRLWQWTSNIWQDVKARGGNVRLTGARQDAQDTVGRRWRQFYNLVRQVVEERSVAEVQKQVQSPMTRLRHEVRQKQSCLKKVRLRGANALGVLLGEGLANESVHGEGLASPQTADAQRRWKSSVARNVALMEAVLAKVNDQEMPVDKFDASIAELTEDDPLYDVEVGEQGEALSVTAQAVAERLTRVLSMALPQSTQTTNNIVTENGRPSLFVRYWLPVTVAIFSSSTVLRILFNRQAQIIQWIQDFGTTTVDFWRNWVVEPLRKIIGTIRHDEDSEVSIMSKRSLEGDMASLERMVVDFAIDNPANATGSSTKLDESQVQAIRAKVREGDLTPVLKAYEKDLASPFKGALRGNLIRALLIQIQKTKVDVEVAMGGIDALLKSQELVFGFVGLTPGILVVYFAIASIRSSLSSSRGTKAAKKQGKMLRQLRNIDRILTDAATTEYGELFYRDQGLLLCDVHVLRQAAEKAMPGEVFKEFAEDAEELCDVRIGAERQKNVANRIRWAYGRYMA